MKIKVFFFVKNSWEPYFTDNSYQMYIFYKYSYLRHLCKILEFVLRLAYSNLNLPLIYFFILLRFKYKVRFASN